MGMKKQLTVKDVADILRSHPQTIRFMIRKGVISAFKLGCGVKSPYLISPEEVERLIKSGKNKISDQELCKQAGE